MAVILRGLATSSSNEGDAYDLYFTASPWGLIQNKFRVYNIWHIRWRKPCRLPGWMSPLPLLECHDRDSNRILWLWVRKSHVLYSLGHRGFFVLLNLPSGTCMTPPWLEILGSRKSSNCGTICLHEACWSRPSRYMKSHWQSAQKSSPKSQRSCFMFVVVKRKLSAENSTQGPFVRQAARTLFRQEPEYQDNS